MSALTEWITNIILFILLATIIDLLLPNSNFQKYTKMVVGLLLILIIVTPVFKLLNVDVDKLWSSMRLSSLTEQKSVENLVDFKKKEIQASQRAYILEQMAVQMKTEVKEELMKQYGVAIDHIQIQPKQTTEEPTIETIGKHIESVQVNLKAGTNSKEIANVEIVSIDTSKSQPDQKQTKHTKQIISFLANHWGIQKSQIVVTGGEQKENEQGTQ
ncbi:stage III sporulation protein AF [Priestia koreensis]|uniref:stage III sporulation protein AF n=1 Tax=Priestia koreensis TaxID=284581 RepID=UPI001F574C61|nr:stage III sporulation protein AF [Priestia koreensis]MCM3002428.1 stage III sporulation protein AF [Priestia koreensis]UNL84151.1 stage III sporulation protein AF [Priestia koreensis]